MGRGIISVMEPNDVLSQAADIARKAKQQQAVLDQATVATLKVLIRENIIRYSKLGPEDWDALADYMLDRVSKQLGLVKQV